MSSLKEIYRSQSLEQSLTPPETLPNEKTEPKLVHPWPEPETAREEIFPPRRSKTIGIEGEKEEDAKFKAFNVSFQDVLLLHGPKQKYVHTKQQPLPKIENDREMLVAVEVVGLNPIDWKAPDFGWGLPALPCISGRDLAGKIVEPPKARSRFKRGDQVIGISTDYRDSRKGAYQQYAIVSDFNACRLPYHLSVIDVAPLGVAFVAASIALGMCLGMDFLDVKTGLLGPSLLRVIRSTPRDQLPEDIRSECFNKINETEGARAGDWIAIWGGSSASGSCAIQLAKLAGLRVIAIIDVAKNGERMLKYGADLLVDRLDGERAIDVVRGVTKGKLRFGLDTRGKESALLLAQAMQLGGGETKGRSHLVGFTGLPKELIEGVVYHSVPIKAFHAAPQVGEGLMIWLEKILEQKLIITPDIEVVEGGLEGINDALDKLRDGTINGLRIVVPLTI